MSFWKHYGFTIALLAGVVAGGICGLIWGEGTAVVRPVGELFLNVVFVLIVPLVAFSMSSATCKVCRSGIAWRLLGATLGTFLVLSAVAGAIAFVLFMIWNPFPAANPDAFLSDMQAEGGGGGVLSLKSAIASSLLLIIAVSMAVGIVIALLREKGREAAAFLESGMSLTVKLMRIVMYAAPVGIGCYFAWTVGSLGGEILGGYADAVLVYLIAALILFFLVNSGWVMLAGGKSLLGRFWRGMVPPSLTAVATSSSAVCIPLGTNIPKDGSAIGGVVKVVFLLSIFGSAVPCWGDFFLVIGLGILVGTVMGAVPTGGMTGELLICSVLGYPPEMAAVLVVVSTLIDIPATLLNVSGNVVAATLVNRLTRRYTECTKE